jgi:hypothetical protein
MTRIAADVEALDALRDALRVFAARQTDALDAAEAEIDRTQAILDDAEQDARYAVERHQAELHTCYREAAFAAAEGGWVDCSGYEYALSEAEDRLARIIRWQGRVQDAVSRYRADERALAVVLESDLPRATAYLADRITALEGYYAGRVLATATAVAAAGGLGLLAAVVGAIRACASGLNRTIGDVGENLTAHVLSEKFGLTEVPFDRSWHGFDRVFRAPGLPLIVVESKVSSAGELRLGQTQTGEQGSPEWVASQAGRMTDHASAQWSPANERIGQLVQTLGAENVPVVTVVVNPVTGQGDVYVRQGSSGWRLARGELDLTQLDPAGPRQPIAPIEHKEGSFGSAEQRG